MSRENSPNYAYGCQDARLDMHMMAQHGGRALGPRPPYPDYPAMYNKGYEETFVPCPHVCDSVCGQQRTHDGPRSVG